MNNNQRKIIGPTPAGGEYAILYFYDEKDNPINEENAHHAYGVEFDEMNNRINETYFVCNKENKDSNQNLNDEHKIK